MDILSYVLGRKAGGGGGGTDYLAQFLMNTLESYESTEVTTVYSRTFQMSTALKTVSLPNCTRINDNAFAYDTALQSVNLPSVTELRANVFEGCSNLGGAVLPSLTLAGNSCFANCSKFKYLDILGGSTNWNSGSIFNNSQIFDTFIIRNNAVLVLSNVNWFNNTCFKSGGTGGTLYVPSALISSYQSASNWSTILGYANNQIKAIEGSIYETQYADGTPIS